MSEVETLKIPEGVDKYMDIDLKLLPGESVELIIKRSPFSHFRSMLVCLLIAAFGFSLYILFSQPQLSVGDILYPAAIALTAYLVWHCGVAKDLKRVIFEVLILAIKIVIVSYFFTFVMSLLARIASIADILAGLGLSESVSSFNINPISSLYGLIEFGTSLINLLLAKNSVLLRLASLALIFIPLLLVPLIYFNAKGHLYYLTNKRIIARRKFLTVNVTTMPLDGIVEVTSFQGILGRLLGFGDIVLSMVSGGGVADSVAPGSLSVSGNLYTIKRKLEGVKDVWTVKDMIVAARERFVQANYLSKIQKDIAKLREIAEKGQTSTITIPASKQETTNEKREKST